MGSDSSILDHPLINALRTSLRLWHVLLCSCASYSGAHCLEGELKPLMMLTCSLLVHSSLGGVD